MQTLNNKNLIIDSFKDEWLDCRIKNSFSADFECAGLFLGMLKKVFSVESHTFTSKRLRTAHRLFLCKNLWRNSNLSSSWDINFSICNFQNKKPFSKFTLYLKNNQENIFFINELSDLSRKIFIKNSKHYHWDWLRGLWGSSGNISFTLNSKHNYKKFSRKYSP